MLAVYGNDELLRIVGRLDLASPDADDEIRLIVYAAMTFGVLADSIEVGRPAGTNPNDFKFAIQFEERYAYTRCLEVTQSYLTDQTLSLPHDINRRDPSSTLSRQLKARMLALP